MFSNFAKRPSLNTNTYLQIAVLVWNTKMISVPWVGEMQRIINRYEDDSVPIFLNYTWLKEIEEYPNFSYDRQEKLAGVEWRVSISV